MKLNVAGVLSDAWAMAKRDRDVVIGVSGLFLLVPQVAQAMFVAAPPALPVSSSDPVALQAWLDAVTVWSKQNDLLVLILSVLSLFGSLTLFTLYMERGRPDVATALRSALAWLLRYVLLALLVTLPVNVGTLLFLIPGLYIKGRLMTVGPVFVGERPIGAVAAFRRSFALTRENALPLMALACVPLLAGDLLAMPFDAIGHALDGAPMANPVVAAVIDLCSGLAHTVATVAAILIEIALYRRLSKGI